MAGGLRLLSPGPVGLLPLEQEQLCRAGGSPWRVSPHAAVSHGPLGDRWGTCQKHDESGTAAEGAAGTSDGHRDGQDGENPWWGGLGSG